MFPAVFCSIGDITLLAAVDRFRKFNVPSSISYLILSIHGYLWLSFGYLSDIVKRYWHSYTDIYGYPRISLDIVLNHRNSLPDIYGYRRISLDIVAIVKDIYGYLLDIYWTSTIYSKQTSTDIFGCRCKSTSSLFLYTAGTKFLFL